jgi:hypothetical protein
MILAETYVELLKNRPHWLFELTVEAASGLAIAPLWRYLRKKHHEKFHPGSMHVLDVEPWVSRSYELGGPDDPFELALPTHPNPGVSDKRQPRRIVGRKIVQP